MNRKRPVPPWRVAPGEIIGDRTVICQPYYDRYGSQRAEVQCSNGHVAIIAVSKPSLKCAKCLSFVPIGKRYGRWVVLSATENKTRSAGTRVTCRCDCGLESEMHLKSLRKGESVQCRRCARRTGTLASDGIKRCRTCRLFLPSVRFARDQRREDKLNPTCKHCMRDVRLKRNGGSVALYDKLFKSQHGRCAVCKRRDVDVTNGLCLDHCHKTKRVRGLLCQPCNSALGLLQDDLEVCRRLVQYKEASMQEGVAA